MRIHAGSVQKKKEPLFEGSLKQWKATTPRIQSSLSVFWDARYKKISWFPCGSAEFGVHYLGSTNTEPTSWDKTLRSKIINCLRSYPVTNILVHFPHFTQVGDSSVGIATAWTVGVCFSAGAGILLHSVQTGYGSYPSALSNRYRGPFPRG
jgi:hypothetical protein